MPELNLYRAEVRVTSSQDAWALVYAKNRVDARRLLDLVYDNKLVDSSVKEVNEHLLKPYQAEVRLSPTSVVLTEILAEDENDAAEIFSLLYGNNWSPHRR